MADAINNGIIKPTGKPLNAKRVWYFLQSVDAPIDSPALLPAFQTEGTTTYGGDVIDEQTKMGRIIQKSTDEQNIDLTQYFVSGDESIDIIKKSKTEGKSVKVWRVEVDESQAVVEGDHNAYPAEFGYGLVDELELSDGDDFVEASYTLNIVGTLREGTFPLSDEDIDMISNMYEYQRPGETTGDYDDIQTKPDTP